MEGLGTLKAVENGASLNLVYHYAVALIWSELFQPARISPCLAVLHSTSQDTRAEIYVPESQKITTPFTLCSDIAIWQLPLQYHLGCKMSVYLVCAVVSKISVSVKSQLCFLL